MINQKKSETADTKLCVTVVTTSTQSNIKL